MADRRGSLKDFHLPALLALVFSGQLARIRELALLQRRAEAHSDELKEPLEFTRGQPPHATTTRRALAGCALPDFSQALLPWMQGMASADTPLVAAVNGKTRRQGVAPNGIRAQLQCQQRFLEPFLL
ncbi:MAG: hypothetical protein K1X74_14335 [Pirellulales bacterium]|nr:hypothetical protein [Pirellulales bacterium]